MSIALILLVLAAVFFVVGIINRPAPNVWHTVSLGLTILALLLPSLGAR